jgi:outer membrane protein TolC
VRFLIFDFRFSIATAALLTAGLVTGQTTNDAAYPIDLPTALRLAGARNLDIQIARERLNEAQANRQSAVEQFFPWLAPGIGYHGRDGLAQAVPSGIISDAHYQSYTPGIVLNAQVAIGDAIYNSLAAKQLVKASDQALETQRRDVILSAAQGYFDLVKTRAVVEVVRQAIQISQGYQQQLHVAVGSGIAFRGDELRVQSQTERYRITLQQTLEEARVAAVTLAQVLHLDSRVSLVPQDTGLVPVTLFRTNTSMHELVDEALNSRPEIKQSQSFLAASRDTKNGAVYGPWIPTLGAQVYGGGLGGGPDNAPGNFGAMGDYTLGLSWRIGPGGLLDSGRINASKARLVSAELADSRLKDVIIGQVVTSLTRVQSLSTQITLAERRLSSASETLKLTQERKQFGVGAVLEDIQAQQDLETARSDYLTTLSEYNKAQYGLSHAVGAVRESTSPPARESPSPSDSSR